MTLMTVNFLVYLKPLAVCGGVRLSRMGKSTTIWSTGPASDDIRWRMWSSRCNDWHEKPKYSEKIFPMPFCYPLTITWIYLGSNTSRHGGKPPTYGLSYSTAYAATYLAYIEPTFIIAESIEHENLTHNRADRNSRIASILCAAIEARFTSARILAMVDHRDSACYVTGIQEGN
jgi:hypothetical protein